MNQIDQTLSVPYAFPVIFTKQLFSFENPALLNAIDSNPDDIAPHRAMVFVEKSVADLRPTLVASIADYFHTHRSKLQLVGEPQILPGGEAIKNDFPLIEKLCAQMLAARLSRHAFVLIVGGGAFLDAIGFAAALVHRGLRQVRIPTTVLSQNDGGVGVKNAVNFAGQKNALGTFAPPWAVLNDFDFLATLAPRQWLDGIAEAFKVAIIRDSDFFHHLVASASSLRQRDPETMRHLVRRCAELHLDHIRTSGDPFEFGTARPLDFGHWAAHKLETMSDFRISHGEAVAVGILLDSLYAVKKSWLQQGEFDAIHRAFREAGLPLWLNELEMPSASSSFLRVFEGIAEFQEHLGGKLCVTYPSGIGARHEVHEIDLAVMATCISELKDLALSSVAA